MLKNNKFTPQTQPEFKFFIQTLLPCCATSQHLYVFFFSVCSPICAKEAGQHMRRGRSPAGFSTINQEIPASETARTCSRCGPLKHLLFFHHCFKDLFFFFSFVKCFKCLSAFIFNTYCLLSGEFCSKKCLLVVPLNKWKQW